MVSKRSMVLGAQNGSVEGVGNTIVGGSDHYVKGAYATVIGGT